MTKIEEITVVTGETEEMIEEDVPKRGQLTEIEIAEVTLLREALLQRKEESPLTKLNGYSL